MSDQLDLRSIDGYAIMAADNPEFEQNIDRLLDNPGDEQAYLHVHVWDPADGHSFTIVLTRLTQLVGYPQSLGGPELLEVRFAFSGTTIQDWLASGWFERNSTSDQIGRINVLLQP